jgi:hypothetical protein
MSLLDALARLVMNVRGCLGLAVCLLGSSCLLTSGALMGWQSVRVSQRPVREGQVVGLKETLTTEEKATFAPVVRFTTADGRTIEFTSGVSSRPPAHAVGDRVMVHYDPGSGAAEIRSFGTLWLFPIAFLGFGALLLGFAMLIAFLLLLKTRT